MSVPCLTDCHIQIHRYIRALACLSGLPDISHFRNSDYQLAPDTSRIRLSNDFDKDCENALSEIANTAHKKYLAKQKGKVKNNKKLNTYQKFITQFVSSQAEVSEKAGIENTRFTKVLNQTADDFYAHEVFSIAKSQNMKLIDAFEQLYE
ncbi:hypothetical protein [Sphingobacterium multivorum]|uniref:hypothetical protein n=1 Tax=Sphingobacterium multivorum TaxID=28454 RepID=UPI00345EC4C6